MDALDPQNARDSEEKVWSAPDLIEDGVKAGQPVPGFRFWSAVSSLADLELMRVTGAVKRS